MSDLLSERRVKTRKPHRCEYCLDEIPVGTDGVLYEWGFYDGASFARYTCEACEPYVGRFWSWLGGECNSGDLSESWRYFMEMVAGEPYRPRVLYGRAGDVLAVNCGNCMHPLPSSLLRLPACCPSCQCRVRGGGR